MTSIQIGDTVIDIASFLDWRDDEGTVVAYLPETDYANLRFSLMSVRKDGELVSGAGVRNVTQRCAEFAAQLHESGHTVWFSYVEPSSEGTNGSLMHYWYVGLDAYVLIISCFVDASMQTSQGTADVLSSVEPTIRSFRKYEEA